MEHNTQTTEISYHHQPAATTKRIWRTFWVLLFLTIAELALGLTMHLFSGMPSWLHLFIKGVICILTLAKAYYIVSVFMHLGDEIRNMIMTVVVPLMLFIWFITALLWDGNAFRAANNRYDKYKMERTMQHPVQKGDTLRHGFGS